MARRPRHVPTKHELVQRLPRGLRPMLQPTQVTDLSMVHNQNLDAIARGGADFETLRQWAGGILTWLRVAELLEIGGAEMLGQQALALRVIERYCRTGRVGFSGPDYEHAKDGVAIMDKLAVIVDQPTASAAAEWSEAQLAQAFWSMPDAQPLSTDAAQAPEHANHT